MKLHELNKLGQSIWLDYIDRGLIRSGGLKKLVEEEGVMGLTSNPTIFQKAISQGKDYEEDIIKLAKQGKTARDIYEYLTVSDIQETADILYPLYEKTHGIDGFISLEPPAQFAYDLPGTIKEVERLFHKVNRKNVMIKMPATPQGVQALPHLIGKGININVTLIFSDQVYFEVAHGYLQGLRELKENGGDLSRVASVASVFVSRIDSAVDKLLDLKAAGEKDPKSKLEIESLRGKTAVANMKAINVLYVETFTSNSFRLLEAQGAGKQRLLFGSTGTKNPAYSDVKYVDELIGKDTINTVPFETLRAFQDHGKAGLTLFQGLEKARSILIQVETLGIDLQKVYSDLLKDGVTAFASSMDSLMAFLEGHINKLKLKS